MIEGHGLAAHLLFRGYPRCPHAKKVSRYSDVDYCDINNKPCLLESNLACGEWEEIQDDILKEREYERQDSPNTA